MNCATIVQKLGNDCCVLQGGGMSYGGHAWQLFLIATHIVWLGTTPSSRASRIPIPD